MNQTAVRGHASADHGRAGDDRRARGAVAPLSRQLRAYARVQTGCRALIEAYYGIGELCAVTILAELGDCRRFAPARPTLLQRSSVRMRRPLDPGFGCAMWIG